MQLFFTSIIFLKGFGVGNLSNPKFQPINKAIQAGYLVQACLDDHRAVHDIGHHADGILSLDIPS